MSVSMRMKRLIRPLIPDRLMARYRLAQHSQQVRTNVDVVIADPGQRRRWLGATPDTYRVVDAQTSSGTGEAVRDVEALGSNRENAMNLLDLVNVDVGVVARVAAPAIVGRRRTEPPLDPIAIAASSEVIAEVGGAPDGARPLPGLLDRLRDAGRRFAVLPVAADGLVSSSREDPIADPSVVILSAVPMHDVGGGSRATQLALEFVRRGYHVTYVALYATQESADLGLRFIHPSLEQARADEFNPAELLSRVAGPGLVVVEIPAAGYRPSVEALRENGWTVMYDAIDDWSDPSLGSEWYDVDTEAWFVGISDQVIASAVDLANRTERMGARATVVPNGVNADLFGGPAKAALPPDFPVGDGPVFGYVGSLYGGWFDWAALERLAISFPEARIVVIGDDKAGHPAVPSNIFFLGLKAQFELPAYVRRFDVGLLPFTVSDMTHAVSPLKVYEYLASEVPVAAPPLRALDGLDGIAVDEDLVRAVGRALTFEGFDSALMIDQHSWGERVSRILELVGLAALDGAPPVRIVRRPVIHYEKNDRVVEAPSDSRRRRD